MILPDVNVLIYAFLPEALEHARYRQWLQSVLEGDVIYGMSPQVLAAVIRIMTQPRFFTQPDRLNTVIAFANRLLEQPHCRIIEPGPRHWDIFCELCRHARAKADLVQDAWFAALAIESDCEWITADRDFSRFQGLRWRKPF